VAATILVFDDTSGLFKSIMAIGIETFKNILSDNSVGASGAQYWNWIKNETLTGFYLDNKPIRKFN
jgi:hypothetical protein